MPVPKGAARKQAAPASSGSEVDKAIGKFLTGAALLVVLGVDLEFTAGLIGVGASTVQLGASVFGSVMVAAAVMVNLVLLPLAFLLWRKLGS